MLTFDENEKESIKTFAACTVVIAVGVFVLGLGLGMLNRR